MPSKATRTRSPSSVQFSRSNSGKNPGPGITSQSIAAGLATFFKQGGRIEVLGNTPLRATATTFSSKANNPRKTSPAQVGKSAARG